MKEKFQEAVNSGQCILCHLLIDDEFDGFIRKKDMRWQRTKGENKSYIMAFAKLVGRKGSKW